MSGREQLLDGIALVFEADDSTQGRTDVYDTDASPHEVYELGVRMTERAWQRHAERQRAAAEKQLAAKVQKRAKAGKASGVTRRKPQEERKAIIHRLLYAEPAESAPHRRPDYDKLAKEGGLSKKLQSIPTGGETFAVIVKVIKAAGYVCSESTIENDLKAVRKAHKTK